jgi:HK97 family phage portal protein
MGFKSWISKFFKSESTQSSQRSIDEIYELLGGLVRDTSSGVAVTPETAIRHSTVYSCIKIISETVAQLPCVLYEKSKDDSSSRRRAENHYLFKLLHDAPNDFMTAFELWQFLVAAKSLRGMGCAYKNMVGSKIIELIPISPDCIQENWHPDGSRDFSISLYNGVAETVSPDHIFCIKGLTLDGKTAVSPIKYMAEMIGLSVAAQSHTAKFFKNGARPAGVLKTPGELKPDSIEALKKNWQEAHGGANSGKLAVLTGGMEYQTITMSPEDSQLLELMGFNRTEICGIFGVPPWLVGAIEKTSSWGTGLEEQVRGFVKFTINPDLVRIKQRISKDLLNPVEKKRYYAEFLTEQFLKGDTKSRNEAYKAALGGTQHPGYMSVNEIRKLENLPPLPGGDELYRPKSEGKVEQNAE